MSLTFDVFRGSEDGRIVVAESARELEPTQVFVRITHSGLCGTDLHYLRTGQVLGHEGIGIVEQVGRDVETPKVGSRVGLGYLHKVCGMCKNCLTGWDIYCERKKQYGSEDPNVGSIASGMVFQANCTIPIPDAISSEDAAPLLCAGATVFTVLSKYGVKSTDRVGVLGVGGLGHLAIKFAAAMGCNVVVLSGSESKREEATAFGAKEFHAMKSWNGNKPEGWKGLDHLLVCGSEKPDYLLLVSLMAIGGAIYPLTVDNTPSGIRLDLMNYNRVKIQGTLVASRQTLIDLMEFAVDHGVKPTIMKFPMTEGGIEEAVEKLQQGKIRYRAVLVQGAD